MRECYQCKYAKKECTSECTEEEVRKCFKEHPEYFEVMEGIR